MGSISEKLKANGVKKGSKGTIPPATLPHPKQGNVKVAGKAGKGEKVGKRKVKEEEENTPAPRNYGKKNGKPGEAFKLAKKGIAGTAIVNSSSGPAAGTFARVEIHGFPLAHVLRQLRAAGYTPDEVRKAFDAAGGMFALIRQNTVRDKMSTRDEGKTHATLTKAQIAALMGKAK